MIDIKTGSVWRKWDLHFHTPSSYDYSDKSVTNEDLIEGLKANNIAVVAITDHLTIDIDRINELKKLSGDEITILPGIELCTESRGNDPIHITGIFPENSDIAYIWKQLEVELKIASQIKGGKTAQEVYCSLLGATKAIHDLEGIVIIHAGSKTNSIEGITNSLPVKMAEKKDIAGCIDIFELGQEKDAKDYIDIVFKSIKKTYPLILCSDNHNIKKYTTKQKLWIKADPTFEGLMQIIYEPESRVFIGDTPEIEMQVKNNPRKYIRSISIEASEGYDDRYGSWFSSEIINLNPELVAVIGNKGSGKSALTDIIGLLGNSHNQRYKYNNGKVEELFSFLNKDKFLKGGCAGWFKGELHWYDGNPDTLTLDASVNDNSPENVEYLPQKYLEKICSNIEDDEFRQKLNEVIFGYVEEKDRFGFTNLDGLIRYLTEQTDSDIASLKLTLHQENESVLSLERKLTFDYASEIEGKLKVRNDELEAHKKLKPLSIPKPKQDEKALSEASQKLSQLDADIITLESEITRLKSEQSKLTKSAEDIKQAKVAIERQANLVTALEDQYDQLFTSAGLQFKEIVSITTKFEQVDEYLKKTTNRLLTLRLLLFSKDEINLMTISDSQKLKEISNSVLCKKDVLETAKKTIIDGLDKPNQEYQKYSKTLELWEKKEKDILGDKDNPDADTLNWLKRELVRIKSVYPNELVIRRTKRNDASKTIFTKTKSMAQFYDSVKLAIDKEIKKYSVELGDYNITIESTLRMESSFIDEFFRYINQAVKGSFYGSDDGRALMVKLNQSVINWENEEQVYKWLEQLISDLDVDVRKGIPKEDIKRDVFRQLKQQMNPVDFYDFLFGFEYLQTKYDLKVDKKDLSELSPGERGGLLLIFYLMLDKRDIPLIIDQPEDNLDNKSVYQILVKFLKRAKKRRQIIMVTHNPNLAVVADAEQLIYVAIDKKNGNDFSFESGSIENPTMNSFAVDILEGTMPAFDNRRLKYRKQVLS